MKIVEIKAYEVLDSRGFPTVEAAVILECGATGSFAVPSGASTGKFEALELRDGDKSRYEGKGVLKAVENIKGPIRQALIGNSASKQWEIDNILRELDGTENKTNLGANATLAVSIACCKAMASYYRISVNQYLGGTSSISLPVPMFNVLNGGAHADSGLEVQEFMIVPLGRPTFREAVRCGVEVYRKLRSILIEKKQKISVGDEGGFAPQLSSNEEALDLITNSIVKAGYKPGEEVSIVIDVAASELFSNGKYNLASSGVSEATSEDVILLYEKWLSEFPIIGIEDGLAEEDWNGWVNLTKRLGDRIQCIGDDIFVTNINKLSFGIERGAANSIIIKPNQIGTLSETIDAIKFAQENKYIPVMANRSAETTDPFIAELAIATQVPQIKTGAPCRGERIIKYNTMIKIETDAGPNSRYFGKSSFNL